MFGAQWKTREAKIIEVPAIPDAMPEFTTTYDIDPHAGDAPAAAGVGPSGEPRTRRTTFGSSARRS